MHKKGNWQWAKQGIMTNTPDDESRQVTYSSPHLGWSGVHVRVEVCVCMYLGERNNPDGKRQCAKWSLAWRSERLSSKTKSLLLKLHPDCFWKANWSGQINTVAGGHFHMHACKERLDILASQIYGNSGKRRNDAQVVCS